MSCEGCQFNCKHISDIYKMEKIWQKEKKYYWWYVTNNIKKVVYMGELQKDHTERCTGAKLTKI